MAIIHDSATNSDNGCHTLLQHATPWKRKKPARNKISVFEMSRDPTRIVKLSTVPEVENEAAHRDSDEYDLPNLGRYPANVKKLLTGRLDQPIKTKPQHIKLFISSTTQDFVVERKILYTDVFPKLREYCADRDFELDIIDFHWTHPLDYFQDHSLLDICLKTLNDKCEFGRIFLVFLGTRYCESLVPPRIQAPDYEAMTYKMKDESDVSVLNQWYRLDKNAVPPCYVLQPVRSLFPEYASEDTKANQLGIRKWKETEAVITRILLDNMTMDEMKTYLKPIYQEEIYNNILEHQDNVMKFVVVDRDFSEYPDSFPPDSPSAKYFDVLDGKHNRPCRNRLESLKDKLRKVAPRSNVIDFNIPWSEVGIDSQKSLDHATYIHDLKMEAEDALMFGINVIIEEFENTKHPPAHVVDSYLVDELELQHAVLREFCSSFTGRETLISEVHSVLSRKKNPIFIHGCEGVGKSAIAAALCATCHDVYPNLVTIFRFIGATPDSQTVNSILFTIHQQLIQLYGETDTLKYPVTKDALALQLDKVTDGRPLIIILDGIDETIEGDGADYSWLPLELGLNVRIILTSTTVFLKKCMQKHNWQEDDIEMFELPTYSMDEAAYFTKNTLKNNRRMITESQFQIVQKRLEVCSLPLYIKFVCHLAFQWSSEDLIAEDDIPKDIEAAIVRILKKMHIKYGTEIVSSYLGFIAMSRYGLTELELSDLMSCNNDVMQMVYRFHSPPVPSFSPCLVRALKVDLGVLLRSYTFRGRSLTVLIHKTVRKVLLETYGDFGLMNTEIGRYFNNSLTKSTNNNVTQPQDTIVEQAKKYTLNQPFKRKKLYNARKLCELPWYGFMNENITTYLRQYITNMDWLLSKLEAMGTSQLLLDIELIYHRTGLKDLHILSNVIYKYGYENNPSELKSITYAIDNNFEELYPKLRTEPDKTVEKNNIKNASNLNHTSSTISPQNPVLSNPSSTKTEERIHGINSLHNVKDVTHNVVSLETETGELKIWDTESMTVVRRITGLLKPMDLRIGESMTAVLRCDRELQYYNIEDGILLCKLKGVLHAKHSYFELSESKTVSALSRNRMAVNVIDLASGNLLSTFKAGEDRFLNSLHVSGNGEYCVCGDETQKPSPLLVWYLPDRKLVHDLRFPNHEFITSIAGITNDGLYYVCACKELNATKNFLTLYDIHAGQLLCALRTNDPKLSTSCLAVCSESTQAVAGLENGDLNVWNLVTRTLKYRITGNSTMFDTICLSTSGDSALTIDKTGKSQTVSVWDVSEGTLLETFTPDEPMSACILSTDGNSLFYALEGKNELCKWNIPRTGTPATNKGESKT